MILLPRKPVRQELSPTRCAIWNSSTLEANSSSPCKRQPRTTTRINAPAGLVRLATSRMAARMVLAPKLARFAHDYPDVVLDLTTTEERAPTSSMRSHLDGCTPAYTRRTT